MKSWPLRSVSAWLAPAFILAVSSKSQAEMGDEWTFHPWLVTQGRMSLQPAERALVVVIDGSEPNYVSYTLAPAYLLDTTGLREAPQIFDSLPSDTDQPNPQDRAQGRRLAGKVSIDGAWPKHATLSLNETPDGGCAGCWTDYQWRHGRWVAQKPHQWLPVWFEPSGGVPVSSVKFANGTTLWERFELLPDSDYPAGRSTFYVDPYGRRKALRQRAEGPKACKGGVRLGGRFSGMALADGGLLSVSANCESQIAEAEYWKGGATRSRSISLPGEPALVPLGIFAKPVTYCARSSKEVVIAFSAGTAANESRRPYVATFNGTSFTDDSPPFQGALAAIVCHSDGTVWAMSEIEGRTTSVWRGERSPGYQRVWQDFTPAEARGAYALTVSFDDKHKPWIIADGKLLGYDGVEWHAYSLTPLPGAETPCKVSDVRWLQDTTPVVVARCDERDVLMLVKAPERVFDR